MLSHLLHRFTACSTPPPAPPPRATAANVHINRLGVLSGQLVSAYRKDPPAGTEPENLRPEWHHEQVQVVPAAVAAVAREAARRIGLDYAGVDVIVDRDTGRAYCLEANAAPGMSEQTLRSLYTNLQRTVRGRLARAS
ncbi:MAG: hypothetical protein ACYDA0_04440 [Candidatus Dormibacteraceae bacterium]